jgi:hypothetical protein
MEQIKNTQYIKRNMKSLCKYRDIFGKVGEGIHSYRFFNIAIADVLQTIIGALILSYITKWSFWWVLGGLFLLGIILHRLFCVPTTVDKWLRKYIF